MVPKTSARKSKKDTKASKKTASKKTASKKAASKAKPKKTATKKTAPKAKKVATKSKKTPAKRASAKKATKKPAKKVAAKRTSAKKKKKKKRIKGDPLLFAPLSEGERADALRIMTADLRLATMTAVGRYRIVAVEPLVVKPPHKRAKHRLANVVVYDYAADRSITAAVDLDAAQVAHLSSGPIQPMLAREEEAAAIAIALSSDDVNRQLGLGDVPQAALHYWSTREADISYRRRSAAVLLGQPRSRPSLVAVVDLLDSEVVEVVAGEQW